MGEGRTVGARARGPHLPRQRVGILAGESVVEQHQGDLRTARVAQSEPVPTTVEVGIGRTAAQQVGGVSRADRHAQQHGPVDLGHRTVAEIEPPVGRDVELFLVWPTGSDRRGNVARRLYVEKSVRMLEFVRPSLHAAIELGRPELRQTLSAGLREDADYLVSALATIGASVENTRQLASAIRRQTLGLALDESVTPAEAGRQLTWLFRRLAPSAIAPVHSIDAARLPAGSAVSPTSRAGGA